MTNYEYLMSKLKLTCIHTYFNDREKKLIVYKYINRIKQEQKPTHF